MVDDNLAIIVGGTDPIYHGSGIPSIRQFREAEEDTIGRGGYFTSEMQSAEGYARGRARDRKGTSVVYSVSIEGLEFLDLRDRKTLDFVMGGFAEALFESLKEPLGYYNRKTREGAIDTIRKGNYTSGTIKRVTMNQCQAFSEFFQSLGYDGLIAYEGGEGDYVGSHDTWLVFNPSQLKVIDERVIV